MKSVNDLNNLDELFGALANSKRREIIHELSLRPATITALANAYDLSLPAIHKHIRCLEKANVIVRKKSGRTNFIALNQSKLEIAKKWLLQFNTNWGNVNASLDNYIARMNE